MRSRGALVQRQPSVGASCGRLGHSTPPAAAPVPTGRRCRPAKSIPVPPPRPLNSHGTWCFSIRSRVLAVPDPWSRGSSWTVSWLPANNRNRWLYSGAEGDVDGSQAGLDGAFTTIDSSRWRLGPKSGRSPPPPVSRRRPSSQARRTCAQCGSYARPRRAGFFHVPASRTSAGPTVPATLYSLPGVTLRPGLGPADPLLPVDRGLPARDPTRSRVYIPPPIDPTLLRLVHRPDTAALSSVTESTVPLAARSPPPRGNPDELERVRFDQGPRYSEPMAKQQIACGLSSAVILRDAPQRAPTELAARPGYRARRAISAPARRIAMTPSVRAHFQRALASARPQTHAAARMADASLALADRRHRRSP